MNNPVSITRRAAFVGLAVAGAALAVPVAATAAPARPSGVLEAIAAHKAAVRSMRRIWRHVERLETLPGRPPVPRVFVGHLITFERDAEGNDIRTPIYSYSHEDISARCEQRCNPNLFQARQIAATREWYAAKHRELTRLIRARNRFDRASGLQKAQAAQKAAQGAEGAALATLLLSLPATAAEATAKRRYIERTALTREWWEAPDVIDRLHEGLMQVAA